MSLIRFATFRYLTSIPLSKKIVGFDTFGQFPETKYEPDIENRENFVNAAGSESLSTQQLMNVLNKKGLNDNIELIEGDINNTVPEYLTEHPELRISLLHVDVDRYEPTVTIMDSLLPKVVDGGIIIFDDYGDFDGETTAIEESISDCQKLHPMPYGIRGAYLVK